MVFSGCDQATVEEHSGSSLLMPHVIIDQTIQTVEGPVTSGIISPLPTTENLKLSISSADGLYSTTWPSIADYPLREPYRPGSYIVEAYSPTDEMEGFDNPFFFGQKIVNMESGQTAEADIVCTLANTIFNVTFSERFANYFTEPQVTVHSTGGGFYTFTSDESRNAYLLPGTTTVTVELTMPSGENVDFQLAQIKNTLERNLYSLSIDVDQTDTDSPRVILSTDRHILTDDVTFTLTPQFVASTPVEIITEGFTEGTAVKLIEGDVPQSTTAFKVGEGSYRSLVLTTQSTDLIALGWPAECDFATADASTLNRMRLLGLKLTGSGNTTSEIDLTQALSHLRTSSPNASFSLTAISAAGKVTGPVTLDIDLTPADIFVKSKSNGVIGLNVAHLCILSHASEFAQNIKIESLTGPGSSWQTAEILSISQADGKPGEWNIVFKLSNVTTEHVAIRLLYFNEEKYRGSITFASPVYKIDVDAFAQLAVVSIEAEDDTYREIVTSMATIYVNDRPTMLVSRLPETGHILVGGLTDDTNYSIKATLYDSQSSDDTFSNTVRFKTEKILDIPNGGFEDVKTGIKYKDLPAGGRYSQNIVDIYNQQNYASYDQYVPKRWATVNDKTFCTAASNYNTWYMQPSAYSIMECREGAYAVCLQTTAWDIHGPTIENYRQTSQPYVDYSRNIPTIAHRAAGKLFLGEYSFNPATGTETYTEGVEFASRPTALNGYYKFLPSVANTTDCGLVRVEIIGLMNGSEIVIASGTAKLAASMGYTTFSIPLSYPDFKIKATKLKIMISSSEAAGSIDYESATIRTYSDPVTSTSLGGTLWIDDLTFSY